MVPRENGSAMTFCDSRHSIPVRPDLNQIANRSISFISDFSSKSPQHPDGLALLLRGFYRFKARPDRPAGRSVWIDCGGFRCRYLRRKENSCIG